MVPINYLAVLAAAASSIVLGFLWYGPIVGKPWMKLMGYTKESMQKEMSAGMGKTYALMTLGALIVAYVFAHTTEFAMMYTKTFGVTGGLMSGFWTWLGFAMPIQLEAVLWEKKSWKLFAINTGYRLVSLLIMGVIIALWR